MTESEPVSQPRDRRVQAALEAYLERVDQGESVDRDAFLAEHAEIADELRSFLETDEDLARLAGESSTSSVARRDAETLVPQKVQGKSSATDSGQLPAQFGRYRVLKPLGSGAMGTVFLAEDTQLQRKVALKTPSFDEDDSGELLERFYREARAAAVLRHSNICPVFDVDQIDGRHFISMAWIEGRTLSAYIQPDNPQPERQILLIIRKLALALREAHEQGIVHRDLKPGNIMIDPHGEPIIMDFGLARRVTTDEDNRITQSGVLVGSPAYMSPEQVEGQPDKVGPASDQYSLGVILYEMLTGQLPFRGSITGVIGQILTKQPTPPGRLRADLDPRIEALCQQMMAKSADERFPSVKDVANEVARVLKTPHPSSRLAATGGSANAPLSTPHQASTAPITDSNVASLYEAARKCMRKRDYEQVVQMLETIPEDKRNEEIIRLLTNAHHLSDEVQFLLAEIDEALRLNDAETALKKAEELLKLKPGHHQARQLKDECLRYGSGLLFWRKKPRTVDGRRVGEGSWVPWIAIPVFLLAFGGASWLVCDYLKSEGTVLDPDPIAGNGGQDNGSVDQDGPAPALAVAPFGEAEAARHQQEWADYLSVSIERDVVLPGGATMTFVLIPPGEFAVGESEGDATRIDQPFYLGVYEVTQEQYQQLMDDNPSERKTLERPVHNVSSDDAVAFCERLSKLPENVAAGNMFRMPTEAEWEYACRAGSTADYSFGDDASQLEEYAWFGENSDRTMHPVGQKAANSWGLYDMHANVWEWCRDNLNGDRPIRGGCWYSKADLCRAGYRREIPASNDSVLVGFRVLLEIPTGDAANRQLNAVPFPENAGFTDARALSELNEPGLVNAYPWISPDGLTLYWTREGDGTSSIRQATRPSLGSPFGSATTVLPDARLASVSPDDLELICLFDADGDGNADELCSSSRSVAGAVFDNPTMIESLRSLNMPKGTAFSSDGLSLLILESANPKAGTRNRIVLTQRPEPGGEWGRAEPLTIRGQVGLDGVTWPSFDAAEDHLLFGYTEPGTRHLEWGAVADRAADPLTWDNARPLLLDGERFVGRGVRYCAASGELFFTRPIGPNPYQEMQLWVAHAQN